MSTNATLSNTREAAQVADVRKPIAALAAAGVLLLIGGAAHPEVKDSSSFDAAVAGMLHDSSWPATHALILMGFVALLGGLVWLRSIEGRSWSGGDARWEQALTVASVLGIIEIVPHLLAYRQAHEFEHDRHASLLSIHMAIQIVSAPAVGIRFAGLAIASAKNREFGNGKVMAVLAVVGGIAFGLGGILMGLLKNPDLSPLFTGAAGFSLWLVVGSIRRLIGANGQN